MKEGEVSGCEQLVAYVSALAASAKSDDEFVEALGRTLAGFANGLEPELSRGRAAVQVGATGYRSELYDGDDHPGRHFTASVVTGYVYGFGESVAIAHAREIGFGRSKNYKDVRLGVAGSFVGNAIRAGAMKRTEVAKWILDNL